jgi:hypothetical protein
VSPAVAADFGPALRGYGGGGPVSLVVAAFGLAPRGIARGGLVSAVMAVAFGSALRG